ncbi:MAG: glycosyltransferase [Bacteroidales bacterium]
MAAVLLAITGLAIVLLYCLQIGRYGLAIKKASCVPPTGLPSNQLKISLVIPVRNEMEHLENFLHDLSLQDYASPNYEVIFVDDHSEDGSAVFLGGVCSRVKNIKFFSLGEQEAGKKKAINRGCEEATGTWIIQTDADCRIPAGFISGHASMAGSGDADVIAGPVLAGERAGLWNMVESLELMSLTGAGIASGLIGKPVMCSGANLSYRKSFYEAVKHDLLGIPTASGDDIFLLLQAKKRNREILFFTSNKLLVTASPTGDPASFFRQRVRWGSKSRYYHDRELLYLAFLIWTANTVMTCFFAGSFLIVWMPWLFLISWLLKTGVEFILLYQTAVMFRRKRLLWLFPLAAIFYYFYITLAGISSMAGRYQWKGRSYT